MHLRELTRMCLLLVTTSCSASTSADAMEPPDERGSIRPIARTEAIADELARLDGGGAVDLDGDGHAEAREIRLPDGSIEFTSDRDGDGNPEYLRRDDGRGHSLVFVDADDDGRPEQTTETWTSPAEQKQVVTRDRDGNGRMDWRTTRTVRRADLDVTLLLEEEDADEDGVFRIVRDAEISNSSHGLE